MVACETLLIPPLRERAILQIRVSSCHCSLDSGQLQSEIRVLVHDGRDFCARHFEGLLLPFVYLGDFRHCLLEACDNSLAAASTLKGRKSIRDPPLFFLVELCFGLFLLDLQFGLDESFFRQGSFFCVLLSIDPSRNNLSFLFRFSFNLMIVRGGGRRVWMGIHW
jgi:hypothetical protein